MARLNMGTVAVFTALWGSVFTGCTYGCPAEECPDYPTDSTDTTELSSSSQSSSSQLTWHIPDNRF